MGSSKKLTMALCQGTKGLLSVAMRLASCTCLILVSWNAAYASDSSPTHKFRSREPTADLYAYLGGFWSENQFNSKDVFGLPFEASLLFPNDWELTLDSSRLAVSGDGASEFQSGDTTLRAARFIRPERGADFISIEYAEVLSKAAVGLTGGVDRWLEVRGQGGYTQLGWDLSFTLLDLDENQGLGKGGYSVSAGYRAQFGRWHVGADYIRTELNADDLDAIDFVVMRRTHHGDAFYGLIQKGLSTMNDAWYFSAGYEFRFSY